MHHEKSRKAVFTLQPSAHCVFLWIVLTVICELWLFNFILWVGVLCHAWTVGRRLIVFVALYWLLCNCLWGPVSLFQIFSDCYFFFFFFFLVSSIKKWDQDSRMWVLNYDSEFVRVVFDSHCFVICEYRILLLVFGKW